MMRSMAGRAGVALAGAGLVVAVAVGADGAVAGPAPVSVGTQVVAAARVASVKVISTGTVQPSRPFRVRVAGFTAVAPVAIALDGVSLGSLTPAATGVASGQFTVPKTVLVGGRLLTAVQAGTGKSAQSVVAVHTDWPETSGNATGLPSTRVENGITTVNAASWKVAWDQPGQVTPIVAGYGAAAVVDGVVYAAYSCCSDGGDGGVATFDAATGKPGWATSFTQDPIGGPIGAPLVVNGKIWLQDNQETLWVLDARDGTIITHFDNVSSSALDVIPGPVYSDGVVIAGGNRATSAFDSTTYQLLWQKSWVGYSAVANGIVFAGAYDALDLHTGEILWSHPEYQSGGVLGEGKMFLCDVHRHLVALDQKTGALIWARADNSGNGLDGCGDVAYTNGVVTSTWQSKPNGSNPLIGYDPATGKILWTGPVCDGDFAQFSVGSVLFDNVQSNADYSIIDPTTGQVIGTLAGVPRFDRRQVAVADSTIYYPYNDGQSHNFFYAIQPAG